jgi:hypothetical protein
MCNFNISYLTFFSFLLQVLLSVLAYENKGGHIIRRLQEEIQREAQRGEHDVTPIMMSLTTGKLKFHRNIASHA